MFWYLFQVKFTQNYPNYTGFIHVQSSDLKDAWQKAKDRTWVRELKFSYGPFLTLEKSLAHEAAFTDRFTPDLPKSN